MVKWAKTRYTGVRSWQSETRKYRGRPDRCFVIRYKRHSQAITETVGWQSEGITQEFCSNLRGRITANIRTGQGYQSLEEKRQLEKSKRDRAEEEKREAKKLNTPFNALAKEYIQWAETNKKSWKDDKSRYEMHIKPAIGKTPISQVSTFHLEKLKSNLKKHGLRDGTIKHVMVLIRQMYNRGSAWGMAHGKNPVSETIKSHKGFLKVSDNRRTRFFSKEEAGKLLAAIREKSLKTHDQCYLSLYRGLRMGEVFSLQVGDIDFAHQVAHVRDPKSGLSRTIYLTPDVEEVLRRNIPDGAKKTDLIFPNRKGEKIRQLSKAYNRAVDDLKLNKGVNDPRDKVVAHTWRHTFASWLTMEGVPLPTVQKLLGHQSLEMTLRYSHLSPSHEREAVEKISRRLLEPQIVEIKKKKRKRK